MSFVDRPSGESDRDEGRRDEVMSVPCQLGMAVIGLVADVTSFGDPCSQVVAEQADG